jgi:hypothetical protein
LLCFRELSSIQTNGVSRPIAAMMSTTYTTARWNFLDAGVFLAWTITGAPSGFRVEVPPGAEGDCDIRRSSSCSR